MLRYLSIAVLGSTAVFGEVVEENVTYHHGSTVLEGFHAYDDAVSGKRPGVLVVHQWTGLGEHEKEQSRRLAALGYNVFAADVYGKGVRPAPPEAGKEAGKYKANRTLFRERLRAALETLKSDERTDTARLAAVGYCFGGMGVLELARAGVDLKGVISFHGSLDAEKGREALDRGVKAKVLVLHGADDPHAPREQVEALKKEFQHAHAEIEVVLYPGAVHSFTQKGAGDDPSKGSAYNAAADAASWEAASGFLKKVFRDSEGSPD